MELLNLPEPTYLCGGRARRLPVCRQLKVGLRLPTARWRLLPDFMIIGAMKAGTTSLYRYLVAHPQAGAALKKEIAFFSDYGARGLGWYRAHFPLRLSTRGRPRLITGEASPSYLFLPWVPDHVARVAPEARFIVLLRNPVDRALSHYHQKVARGTERRPLYEACECEIRRLEERPILAPRPEDRLHRREFRHGYVARGLYLQQLQNWARLFPRERFCVMSSEFFYQHTAATMERVWQFLNLPGWEGGPYRRYNPGRYRAVDAADRQRLVDYFRPHNSRLFEFLGERFEWDR